MKITGSIDVLQRIYDQIATTERQLSSGRRMSRPSDDPASLRSALRTRSARSALAGHTANLEAARSELLPLDASLQQVSSILTRAREIAVLGLNATSSAADRASMATEVDGLLRQLLGTANGKAAGGFLFGGTGTDVEPMTLVSTSDGDRVQYRGDSGKRALTVGRALTVQVNLPGNIFQEIPGRGATRYEGDTGAAPGTGSDALSGADRLTVQHQQTLLGGTGTGSDPVSGLAVGASSVNLDTLLGHGHSIDLVDTSGTGTAGTVSINGGPAQNWTSTDANLAVTTADGSVLHLDFQNITAGFSGPVAADSDGTLSMDGGLTQVAIDFGAANQIVTDSETGQSLFVNSTGIQRTGVDEIMVEGGFDVFQALIELRDRLRGDGDLDDDQRTQRLQESLSALTAGQDAIVSHLSDVGSRLRLLELQETRIGELDLQLAQNQSRLEDVDVPAAASELVRAQTMLQAALSVNARILNQPTLLDLL